ncbi:MAG: hypothetical protein J6A59_10200 [Lachnospiraceae bacterium]|nr:hypothetical protein [Lachnospiraceae bacterium]
MANKKIDSIKKAGSSLDKLFSGASESVTEPTKKTTKRAEPAEPKKVTESPQKVTESPQKAQKKVFSFRAEVDQVDSWRLWADAKGLKVDELGTLAMTEYIKKHSLTEDQKKIYELKRAQKKS